MNSSRVFSVGYCNKHTSGDHVGFATGKVFGFGLPYSIVLILLVLAVSNSRAQSSISNHLSESTSGTLTLEQAREISFQRNWDLLAAKSGIDQATAQLIVVREFPNPVLSLSTVKIGSHESSTYLANGNSIWNRSYDTIAAVTQLIEIAGKRADRRIAARAGIEAARARFYDAKRTLDQGVTKAYIAVLFADESVRILNQSSQYLGREAAIAGERFKAGDISDADKKQIEINAEQYELQARSAEATAVQNRIAVEILMGVDHPQGKWIPTEKLESLINDSSVAHSDVALVGSPTNSARADIRAAEADLRSGLANFKLQKAIRVPDPTISLQYEHEPPGGGPPIDTVGIGVSFPLPLWNLNGGNIRAAQATVTQYQIALGKAKTQVAADIANAQISFQEAQRRWLKYHDATAPKSTEVRKAKAYAYEKGGATLVDLLDAERTDNDVRLATAQAMSDTASALADLAAAKSVLTDSDLNRNP